MEKLSGIAKSIRNDRPSVMAKTTRDSKVHQGLQRPSGMANTMKDGKDHEGWQRPFTKWKITMAWVFPCFHRVIETRLSTNQNSHFQNVTLSLSKQWKLYQSSKTLFFLLQIFSPKFWPPMTSSLFIQGKKYVNLLFVILLHNLGNLVIYWYLLVLIDSYFGSLPF